MKPRSFHKTKRTITGVNGQPAEWEEVLAKYTSGSKCCVSECVNELNRQHIYSKMFTSLAIRAVQIKTRLKFHLIQVKKTNNKKFW